MSQSYQCWKLALPHKTFSVTLWWLFKKMLHSFLICKTYLACEFIDFLCIQPFETCKPVSTRSRQVHIFWSWIIWLIFFSLAFILIRTLFTMLSYCWSSHASTTSVTFPSFPLKYTALSMAPKTFVPCTSKGFILLLFIISIKIFFIVWLLTLSIV